MRSRREGTRGFTGVELLVVVAVVGLLGGIAAGTHLALQRRAAERVVSGDLDAYAQAEMSAREESGRFASLEALAAGGFRWSDDVELSHAETAAERTFVRIRHRRTGYACALDLSPTSLRARNRKVCRPGADDPALAPPPEITADVPRVDTTSVARPLAPVPPVVAQLLSPGVSDPADVVLEPGASGVAVFTITNRSAAPRDFTLAASSARPSLASVPEAPAGVRLEPGESAEVPVRVAVAPLAAADGAAEVELRVIDAAEGGLTGSGVARVRAALVLAAPEVSTPAAEVRDAGESFTADVRLRNATNAARVLRVAAEVPGGSALVASAVPDQALDAYEERTVRVGFRLSPEAEGETTWTARVVATDRDAPGLSGSSGDYRVAVRAVLAAPELAVFPALTLLPGETGTSAAVLTSRSNVPTTVCFETSVAAGSGAVDSVLASAPRSPECVSLAPRASSRVAQEVAVSGEVRAGASVGVEVRAFDRARAHLAASRRFAVTGALSLVPPALAVPATPPLLAWTLGQERVVEYTVANRSNAPRELCLEVLPRAPALVAASPLPECETLPARAGRVVRHALRAAGSGELEVDVRVRDRLAPGLEARASFGARVADARPVALWANSSPAYARRWIDFDASASYSPTGSRIARYHWSWGLFNQRWTGWRFEPGPMGIAADSVSAPTARRAYDYAGRFEVCLVVEDEQGRRSDPSCGAVTALAETRARLAFRYRGWWHDTSFCVDVPWSSQCPREHGNARWEILLGQSQGDVPIRRAWADVRVAFWQTDDRFARTYAYAGNADVPPFTGSAGGAPVRYDFLSGAHDPEGPVESGRWRVLDTEGTAALGWPAAPRLAEHPLVLNADLGSATGAFDGGPHWAPDAAWITLHVEDATGRVTEQSGYLDHDRGEWRGGECIGGTTGWFCTRGYERLSPTREPPAVTVARTGAGASWRFTSAAESPDGRVVDGWWEVTRQPLDPGAGAGTTRVLRADVVAVDLAPCEEVSVSRVAVDERGQQGRGYEGVARGTAETCGRPGGTQ